MGKHLNDNQFNEIIELHRQGEKTAVIAVKVGCKPWTVQRQTKHTIPPTERLRAQTNRGCGSDKYKMIREKIIIPMLKKYPKARSKAIIQKVWRDCPEANKRSLYKQIADWRPHYAPEQERFFDQEKEAGHELQLDSTFLPGITIKGQKADLRIFHAYFPFSGRTFMKVYQGGESWQSFEQGLTAALKEFNGVPTKIVTDSLGAVWVNQPGAKKRLTERMTQMSKHYRFQATRINLKKPNENGSVEKAHDHRKNEIEDQLLLRGSREFNSFEEVEALVAEVVATHNQKSADLFELERSHLKPLPSGAFQSSKLDTKRVYKNGTFSYQRVTYSVPAHVLVGPHSIEVFQDRIELFNQRGIIATVPRAPDVPKKERGYQINYRHLLPSLRKKPRALLGYKFRNHMFPDRTFQSAHELAREQMKPTQACQYTIDLLTLAEQNNNEAVVAKVLEPYVHHNILPTTEQIQQDLNQIKEQQLDISSGSAPEKVTQQSTTIAAPEPDQSTADVVNDEVKFPRITELDQDGDNAELTTQFLTLLFEQFLTKIGVDVNLHTNNIQQFLVTIKNNPPKRVMQGGPNA